MTSPKRVGAALLAATLMLAATSVLASVPVPRLRPDMPVRYPSASSGATDPTSGATRASTPVAEAAAAYAGDAFEIRLAPAAARTVYARAGGARQLFRSGVASLDAAAANVGGAWFEPEFAGEVAPPPGSRATDFTAFQIVHLPAGVRLEDALARFAALGEVASVSPLPILRLTRAPDDSLFAQSWWYEGSGGGIAATSAWDLVTGDPSIVVAVLDAGVVPYHPDLSGLVAGDFGNLFVNDAERLGLPGMDDDGNGYVDDVSGWDFVDLASSSLAKPGEDWRDEDADPNDMVGHGTACAGLIGALTDNRIGVAGTAWRVRLMPLRMGWAFPGAKPGEGEVRMDFAARAIRYATLMGASVISASWANDDTDGLGAAVGAATDSGVTVVVSAGNYNSHNALGDRPDVISVSAIDSMGQVAVFSKPSPNVWIAAPGVGLRSTWSAAAGADSLGLRTPTYNAALDGTSFAAPLVAGAAALLQADRHTRGLDPLTPEAVGLRLWESADDISVLNPFVTGYGRGKLDVARALTEDPPSSAVRMGGLTVGPSVVVAWQGGTTRIACVTSDRRLVIFDGLTRDTVAIATLPDDPEPGLAAANMGPGFGAALFCGTVGGSMLAYDFDARPLPGWPTTATGAGLRGGPALGDLDGDGVLEVVCGADDGGVMAWHADGSDVTGFPRTIGSGRVIEPVALSDLDGVAGVEIIAISEDGRVTALRGNGTRLTGWPKIYPDSPRAAVVDSIGSVSAPAIVFAVGDQLHVLDAAGVERGGFPVTLAGPVVSELALADMDGDDRDEIVMAIDSPPRLNVCDASGASLTAFGWPKATPMGQAGVPVVGRVPGSTGPVIALAYNGVLSALDAHAQALPEFPKPGAAGDSPSLVDVSGDGLPELVAGSGRGPSYYIYRAGSGALAPDRPWWPTARGNYARTGSALYAPPLFVPDFVPPAAVDDFRLESRSDSVLTLGWTAPGDDGHVGRADHYLVRATQAPMDSVSFESAPYSLTNVVSVDAGGAETVGFGPLPPGTRLNVAVITLDEAGNRSALSNVIACETAVGGPLGGTLSLAMAPGTNPSRSPVRFYWHGDPASAGSAQRLRIYDLAGRVRFTQDLGNAAGGIVEWDGRGDHGERTSAGVYFARLTSGAHAVGTRVVLLP